MLLPDRNSRRWRVARDGAGCLFIGMCITVIVSWCLARHGNPPLVLQKVGEETAWPVPVPKDWPPRAFYHAKYRSSIGQIDLAWGHNDERSLSPGVLVSSWGWPLPAMESRLHRSKSAWWPDGSGSFSSEDSMLAGWALAPHLTSPLTVGWTSRRAPLVPLPVGFMVNSVLAGTLAYGLVALWRLHLASRGSSVAAKFRRLALIAIAGVLLALGVALAQWARVQYQPMTNRMITQRGTAFNAGVPKGSQRWPVEVPADWPDSPSGILLREAGGVRTVVYLSRAQAPAVITGFASGVTPSTTSAMLVQTGWPMPCLQSEETEFIPSGGLTGLPGDRSGVIWNVMAPGVAPPTAFGEPAAIIPVRPLMLGLVANTLFYGTAIGIVVWGWGAVRTLRRRRRGLCLRCAYDARGLERCPECGQVCEPSTRT